MVSVDARRIAARNTSCQCPQVEALQVHAEERRSLETASEKIGQPVSGCSRTLGTNRDGLLLRFKSLLPINSVDPTESIREHRNGRASGNQILVSELFIFSRNMHPAT